MNIRLAALIMSGALALALVSDAHARRGWRHSAHHQHGASSSEPERSSDRSDDGAGRSEPSDASRRDPRRSRPAADRDPVAGFIPGLDGLVAVCSEEVRKFSALSTQTVERQVQPTEEQRAAFAELQRASAAATDLMRAGCPAYMSREAAARLNEVAKGLETLKQAADLVGPAIGKLYGQLDDEQKARINASPVDIRKADDRETLDTLSRTCARPPALRGSVRDVARSLHVTERQRPALEQFWLSFENASSRLKAACPSNDWLTPPRRLAATRQRADAVLQFVGAVRQELATLFASLNDQQITRLNMMAESE
jgi:hypothetical protein